MEVGSLLSLKINRFSKHMGLTKSTMWDFHLKKKLLRSYAYHAFQKSSPWDGFEKLGKKVAKLCGNPPLGLCVVGSSLRGESNDEWELMLSSIETSLDRKIVDVLRVGYDRLLKIHQVLFLHIACFFNNGAVDLVTTMLANSNVDVVDGLKMLADKSLLHISQDRWIVMHSLLQQLGRQVVNEESNEPGKRQFLVEANEIRDVLANETGTGSIIGISCHVYNMSMFLISGRAFEKMRNLRFLRFYDKYVSLRGDMTYLPRLRLLDWYSYPGKCLPKTFQPDCLVELSMQESKLEKLWGGIQPLSNLKILDLRFSAKLKEIPNLSTATNLETLKLEYCTSLVKLPSSIRNLHKLKRLDMRYCIQLRVIPTNIDLASLEFVDMSYCSKLTSFPDISTNIKTLNVHYTKIKDVSPSIAGRWLCLESLSIGSKSLKRLTHVPECVTYLDLSYSDIKRIPDCIICLPLLSTLYIKHCRKLVSLQGLPHSLSSLNAAGCGLLKSVCYSLKECCGSRKARRFIFSHCVSLDEEIRRVLIQGFANKIVCIPSIEIPAEFTHKARGNSITISSRTFSPSTRFKACLLFSSNLETKYSGLLSCLLIKKGVLIHEIQFHDIWWSYLLTTEHLLVFCGDLFGKERCLEVDVATIEFVFEFPNGINNDRIIDCGIQFLNEEGESSSSSKNISSNI